MKCKDCVCSDIATNWAGCKVRKRDSVNSEKGNVKDWLNRDCVRNAERLAKLKEQMEG
jgi:hypothetical protein